MNRFLLAATPLLLLLVRGARADETPLTQDNLDPTAFTQWVGGSASPAASKDGARHVAWTRTTQPSHDGVAFGGSRAPGPRYLRVGWRAPFRLGAVIARGGGQLSVLKPGAPYPGRMDDDSQWIPAARLVGRGLSRAEVGRDEYAVWVLPTAVSTRAVRFKHVAAVTDRDYAGWLGGLFLLGDRAANMAPQAAVDARLNPEKAGRVADGTNNGTWQAWDAEAGAPISATDPQWLTLVWPAPVKLSGLAALWAGFGAADAQVYTGPAQEPPRNAPDSAWRTVAANDHVENRYACTLGLNWLDFGEVVTTRAVRLRMTSVTAENHPHLQNNTRGGRRVWLGELMALSPLGAADLRAALLPSAPAADHPPIPVRFTLARPGYVTLVIEDGKGKRVRNLVSAIRYPAGRNVAWWDGTDDLGRDVEAARHGIYSIPAQYVAPGRYRVRGLVRDDLHLRYELTVYNSGNPPWETEDSTGGWLTNHTPPQAALFVPADRAPGGKPLVYLGSFVSEGGAGLAWVDMQGRKQGGRGWVGGAWTAAPHLAIDLAPNHDPDTYAYVGAPWSAETDPAHAKDARGEVRLTALTAKGDRAVIRYPFTPPPPIPAGNAGDAAWGAQMGGLAAHAGIVAFSMSRLNQIVFVDSAAGKVCATLPAENPRGIAFDMAGRLLVLAGPKLQRITLGAGFPADMAGVRTETLIDGALEDPSGIAVDAQGILYVSDRGKSHQVKVFSAEGRLLRTVGRAGAPAAGPYDPLHMNNPAGMAVDAQGRLWVTEADYQPKRVSVWSPEGKLLKALYGPAQYGGGGKLDPRDPRRFYYHGMEFALDWKSGASRLARVYYRPAPGDQPLPGSFSNEGTPETPLYAHGRQYFTNAHNVNPTGGASAVTLWILRSGTACPVAACGRASEWPLLRDEPFAARWPAGIKPDSDPWRNPVWFLWSDTNGDGRAQPAEVTLTPGFLNGLTVADDLSFLAARHDGAAARIPATGFTPACAPVYSAARIGALVPGAQDPTTSGGDQLLLAPSGWSVLTVAPKPFAPQSLGGAYRGVPRWSYPSLWPGLHASHESPVPDRPGEIIGTTRLLGDLFTPAGGTIPLWLVNGNQGNMYLFTEDGLFVSELFRDVRQGKTWSMPVAQRGMPLDDITLHDENFWPSVTCTAAGKVYIADGARTSLVRLDGLASLRRLPDGWVSVTSAGLEASRAYTLREEARRQRALGSNRLTVALRTDAPAVDGKLDDWQGADWAVIDRRGVAAYFDSSSKPYDVAAAVAVAGDQLYAAFRTGDPNLLRNSGETINAPFKSGGALDLMIGTDPGADDARQHPVAGDLRLLVTLVKGKPLALIYRPVVPGAANPVAFSSPWRTLHIDRVEDVSGQVRLAGADGNFEFAIPLAALGLSPAEGRLLRGDIGILRGNGFQTLQRVYWSNKATGITSDVPSEAELTPALWGHWLLKGK